MIPHQSLVLDHREAVRHPGGVIRNRPRLAVLAEAVAHVARQPGRIVAEHREQLAENLRAVVTHRPDPRVVIEVLVQKTL